MTKRLLALLLALPLLFAACGDSDDGDDGGVDAAGSGDSKGGTLTVCSDIPYAPFEFEDDDGKLKGVDVDLVKAMGEEMGRKVEFKDTDFDGIFAALAAGNCDMIASSVSITDERKKENDFTDGYFEIQQSMLVRKGDEKTLKDFASLKGKVVGVQSETTGAAFAAKECGTADCEIKEFTGADELFTALKAKQVDAVVQDFPINSYNAETTGDTVVSATFDADEPEQYGFVVPKDDQDLLVDLNEALSALRETGKYDEILKTYLGDAATKS
jgi:polar amino acid transport system substrate-binding protein